MSTVIKLSGGDLGKETMLVRCDLSRAESPVEVDYCEGGGWCSTQYQCGHTSHRTAGLAKLGKELAAHAIQMPDDDFDCDWEDISEVHEMAAVLREHGDRFTGNNVEDEAQDWIDHDFTAPEADEWCGIGVWDAGTAMALHNAGLSARDVARAAQRLIDGCEDAAEEYTDGDPVYSVCNGDTAVDVLIEAAQV